MSKFATIFADYTNTEMFFTGVSISMAIGALAIWAI